MQRSPSTIRRELHRNTISARGYLPHTAHQLSVTRRARPRTPKIVANDRLRAYVQGKLSSKWSPQQISQRLVKEFPTAKKMRVSTATIYQAIFVQVRGELRLQLGTQLRRGRIARKPRSSQTHAVHGSSIRCGPSANGRPRCRPESFPAIGRAMSSSAPWAAPQSPRHESVSRPPRRPLPGQSELGAHLDRAPIGWCFHGTLLWSGQSLYDLMTI